MRLRAFRPAAACLSALMALALPQIACADDHLPIIDVEPILTFAGAGQAHDTATTKLQNGNINVAGSITIPIAKGISASYDRIVNGVYNNTFDQVILPIRTAVGGPGATQPGSYNDEIQGYRIDGSAKGFTLEGGLETRHRICCPASGDPSGLASTEWHLGYAGLTYVTRPFSVLHNSLLALNITGHTAAHNPPPNALLFEQVVSPGVVDVGKREYGTTQAATVITPFNPGFSTTATYTWGAFDYFENYPYPLTYGIWVFTAKKQFNKVVSLTLREANLWQRPNQQTPFPGNAIHVVDWSLIAGFHINTNHIF